MKHLLPILLLICGCYRVPDKIEPQLPYCIEEAHVKRLPSSFAPLTLQERNQEWGKEYLIGVAFAKDLDLYRAITAFKRAQILAPADATLRRQEISYNILLSYYLGNRYCDVIDTFETSDLTRVDNTFPAYHDLLIILYESYNHIDAPLKAEQIFRLMERNYPETTERLYEASVLYHGDITELQALSERYPDKTYLQEISDTYCCHKKSVAKAQTFNAILPGAGYFYVGQKQSGVTALLLNGAFITASYFFFKSGNVAAGIITTSFESGWYFGGIYGAGEAAKLYNERLYEQMASCALERERLYPVLRLRYSF